MKLLMSTIAVISLIYFASSPMAAESQDCVNRELVPAGTFEAVVKSVGMIIGGRWGEGTITLKNGDKHRFSFSGAKIMEFGAAKKHLKGTIYNMKTLDEFPGTFLGIGGGLTVVTKGLGGVSMTNSNCVVMNARPAKVAGFQLSNPIAPGGVKIKLLH